MLIITLNSLALMLNVLTITLTRLCVKYTHINILMMFILVIQQLSTPHYFHFLVTSHLIIFVVEAFVFQASK